MVHHLSGRSRPAPRTTGLYAPAAALFNPWAAHHHYYRWPPERARSAELPARAFDQALHRSPHVRSQGRAIAGRGQRLAHAQRDPGHGPLRGAPQVRDEVPRRRTRRPGHRRCPTGTTSASRPRTAANAPPRKGRTSSPAWVVPSGNTITVLPSRRRRRISRIALTPLCGSLAVDEDRAALARRAAHDRPARQVVACQHRAAEVLEHQQDVDRRAMVGHDQARPVAWARAAHRLQRCSHAEQREQAVRPALHPALGDFGSRAPVRRSAAAAARSASRPRSRPIIAAPRAALRSGPAAPCAVRARSACAFVIGIDGAARGAGFGDAHRAQATRGQTHARRAPSAPAARSSGCRAQAPR